MEGKKYMAMFMVTHGIITQFTVQESLNVYAQIYQLRLFHEL